jgi:NitT/TauT family transport system substrate-binding protein
MRKIQFSFVLVIVLLVAVIAPAHAAPRERQTTTLKMGLLPILDVLPFYVADQAGYFTDEGLKVELVPVSSALERDQLLISGEIDGMLNDLVSTGIFNQDKPMIQIVAMARRAYPGSPQFRILAAPNSGITTPQDLKGVEIAISENSVIYYITQRILEHDGMSASDLAFRAEPNIPIRFQLLMEGTYKAACLPDPLGQAAMQGGAILVADDTSLVDEQFSQSVLTFRTEITNNKPDAVEAFLRAWMHAAADINADPNAYRDLWLEKTSVPDSVKDTYVLPPFPIYEITQTLAWDDTMQWLVNQNIVDKAASYDDSVNPTFLDAIKPAATTASTSGDAANGEVVFNSWGCEKCHAVDAATVMIGPPLGNIREDASEAPGNLSLDAYIRQSIVDPGAYVVDDFTNIMPTFDTLSDSDLNDLVAYVMSLN